MSAPGLFRMPIPEPGIFRPSSLTRKQQEAELAACVGNPVASPEAVEELLRQITETSTYGNDSEPYA